MKLKVTESKQSGFSLVVGMLYITALLVLLFSGWHALQNNDDNDTEKAAVNNPIETQKSEEISEVDDYVIPVGFILYDNKDLEFKLTYPLIWGDISMESSDSSGQRSFTFTDEGEVKILRDTVKETFALVPERSFDPDSYQAKKNEYLNLALEPRLENAQFQTIETTENSIINVFCTDFGSGINSLVRMNSGYLETRKSSSIKIEDCGRIIDLRSKLDANEVKDLIMMTESVVTY